MQIRSNKNLCGTFIISSRLFRNRVAFNCCKPDTSGIFSILLCNLNRQICVMIHNLPTKLASYWGRRTWERSGGSKGRQSDHLSCRPVGRGRMISSGLPLSVRRTGNLARVMSNGEKISPSLENNAKADQQLDRLGGASRSFVFTTRYRTPRTESILYSHTLYGYESRQSHKKP